MSDREMTTNYIYLLQEREFLKTKENVFKVGMTTKQNHERFNQYPKGSILLFQMICENCKNMENQIITSFKEKFTQRKDIGTEYFQGNYKNMIDIIYSTLNCETQEEEQKIEGKKLSDIQDAKFENIREKIKDVFLNYKDDLCFGGNKKLIKISLIDTSYICYYINPHFNIDNKDASYFYDNDMLISTLNLTELMCDENDKYYFSTLIGNVISINEIYDITSQNFIKKINNTKMKINIENYDEFVNLYKINDKININDIYELLCFNMVINNKIYTSIDNKIFKKIQKIKDFGDIDMHLKNNSGLVPSYTHITLYKINNKYYDRVSFIRKYIPYVIRWDTNNDFYIVNREYEYIGLNSKSVVDFDSKGQSYLFHDGNQPWNSRIDYVRMCNEYRRIKEENSLNICKNPFNINIILSLLD